MHIVLACTISFLLGCLLTFALLFPKRYTIKFFENWVRDRVGTGSEAVPSVVWEIALQGMRSAFKVDFATFFQWVTILRPATYEQRFAELERELIYRSSELRLYQQRTQDHIVIHNHIPEPPKRTRTPRKTAPKKKPDDTSPVSAPSNKPVSAQPPVERAIEQSRQLEIPQAQEVSATTAEERLNAPTPPPRSEATAASSQGTVITDQTTSPAVSAMTEAAPPRTQPEQPARLPVSDTGPIVVGDPFNEHGTYDHHQEGPNPDNPALQQ